MLYGRDNELLRLTTLVDGAVDGHTFVAVVEGEAGIGKSSLVDAVAIRAADGGVDVVRLAAHELEQQLPFGPFAEFLGGRRLRSAAAAVDAIEDALQRRSLSRPVLLVMEDLHWADTGTLTALARTARTTEHLGTSVLATTRPSPMTDPLTAFMRQVDGSGLHLKLDGLDDLAAVATAEAVLGTPIGPHLQELLRSTAGNPLFIRELVAALSADHVVVESASVADIANVELPPSLSVTILRSIGFLPSDAIEALRFAAVLGSPFLLSDLGAVMGSAASAALAALRPAIEADIIRAAADGFRFRHDLIQQSVYSDLPAGARAALHREAGRALVASGVARSVAIAEQFDRAASGPDTEAAAWLKRAMEDTALIDHVGTLRFIERTIPRVAPGSAEQTRLQIGAAFYASEIAPSPEDVPRLSALLDHTSDVVDRWRLQVALGRRLTLDGRTEEAERVTLAERRPLSAQAPLAPALTLALALAGDVPRADAVFDQVLANVSDDEEATTRYVQRWSAGEAWATAVTEYNRHLGRAQLRWLAGRSREAAELVDAAAPHIAALDTQEAPQRGHGEAMIVYADAGRPGWRTLAHSTARTSHNLGSIDVAVGFGHWLEGEWDAALAVFEPLAERAGEWSYNLAYTLAGLIEWDRGNDDAAQRWLDRAITNPGLRVNRWLEAVMSDTQGDGDRAFVAAERVWRRNADRGHHGVSRYFAADLVRIALRRDHADLAAEIVETMEGVAPVGDTGLAHACAQQCRGIFDADATKLTEAAALFESSNWRLVAARAYDDAAVALAHRETTTARLYRDRALATYDSVGALRLRDALQQVVPDEAQPRRTRSQRATSGWESLTPSETRVVELVADGLTYGDVGAELFISRRTVETHVAHVFDKLGVKSKTELIRAARSRG